MKTKLGLTYLTTELHDSQVMVALTNQSHYAFIWHGGCYIDVCFVSSMGTMQIEGTWYQYGQECINVWDYDKHQPEIDWLDSDEFLYVINEWLGER